METGKLFFVILFALFVLSAKSSYSQADTSLKNPVKLYVITTNDGGQFMGTILFQDAKEVLIDTKDRGQISIPKYQIKEMKEIRESELTLGGEYIPAEVFSSRYFLTTNGLPIEKHESYILWNLWGPDFEFGVGKNFGMGVMSSWIGVPIIGTAKYSIELGEKTSLGLGVLLGTGTWVVPDFGLALPYAALTFGDRKSNLTFSGGYGAVFSAGNSDGRTLLSFAGMTKIGKNTSLVFDSFIVPSTAGNQGFGLLIPCVRLQTESKKAFQFGFGALFEDGNFIPAPIPMIQWFRKL